MQTRKAAGALGLEVHGLDLSAMPSDGALTETVAQQVMTHGVAFYRDQALDVERFAAAAAQLGEILPHQAYETRSDTGVQILESTPENPSKIEMWHSDMTFSATPPSFTLLYAEIIPEYGGDTLWSSATQAWDDLSAPMQGFLSGLHARHDFRFGFKESLAEPGGEERLAPAIAANPPVTHPIMRTHPVTGAKALYVNSLFTCGIEGLTQDEARPLLAFLYDHITAPERTVRLQWQPGTVAIWDNRITQHKPVNDYFPQHRRMLRVTIKGEPPA